MSKKITVAEVKARIVKLTQQRDEARQQVNILENANASLKKEIKKWEQYFYTQAEAQEPIFDDPYKYKEQPQPFDLTTPSTERTKSKKVQTIELTSKKWKGMMIAGGLLCIIGGMLTAQSLNAASSLPAGVLKGRAESQAMFGIMIVLAGGVTYICGRVGKFWFHE